MLYLHIGTPKSGTTSIQRFLRSNAASLPDQGIFYRRQMIKNMSMMEFVKAMRSKNASEVASRYAQELAGLCQSHETVVSSNEMFAFLFVPDAMMPAIVKEVRCPIKVICYIRRPDSYLESVYKQRAKNGFISPDPMKFYRNYLPNLQYENFLDVYAKYVGKENVIVRVFDRSVLRNGNVIYDFADQIGLSDLTDLEDVEITSNPSLSRPLSELVGTLARNSGVQANAFVNDIVARANKGVFRSGDTYDLATRRDVMDVCRASLETVRKSYRPDLSHLFKEDDLGDDAVSSYPDVTEQSELNRVAGHEISLTAGKMMKLQKAMGAKTINPQDARRTAMSKQLAAPLQQAAQKAFDQAQRIGQGGR